MKRTLAVISVVSILLLFLATLSCKETTGADDDLTLSNLLISSGTLTPTFTPDSTSYTASVPYAETNVTVTPTTAGTETSITINEEAVLSGSASSTISLDVGENTIVIVVTAPDGETQKTYTVKVIREECEPKTVKPDTSVGASLALLQPLGCEELYLGDSLEIKWNYYKQDYGRVAVMLSLEGGAEDTFEFIWNNAISHDGPSGGNVWLIPDSAKYVSDYAVIKIYDYDGGFDDVSGSFSIKQK